MINNNSSLFLTRFFFFANASANEIPLKMLKNAKNHLMRSPHFLSRESPAGGDHMSGLVVCDVVVGGGAKRAWVR